MTNDEITEKIIFYTERLESSVYPEDIEDALHTLLSMCPTHAFTIGIHTLPTLFNSLQTTTEATLQSKLFTYILTTSHKDEFIDIILKTDHNITALYKHLKTCKYACKLVAIKSGSIVANIMKNNLNMFIDNLADCVEYLRYIINERNIQYFVFNGLFEQLLNGINESENRVYIATIEKMLQCSLQAQNYFMELKWKRYLGMYNINGVCTYLLDKRNLNYKGVQKYVQTEDLLDCSDIVFLNRFLYNNGGGFLYAEQKGLSLNYILTQIENECSTELLDLFATYVRYRKVPMQMIKEESDYYYTLLNILIVNYNNNISYGRNNAFDENTYNNFEIKSEINNTNQKDTKDLNQDVNCIDVNVNSNINSNINSNGNCDFNSNEKNYINDNINDNGNSNKCVKEDDHIYTFENETSCLNDIENAQLSLLQYKNNEDNVLTSIIIFLILMEDALLHVYLVKEMLNDSELSYTHKSLLALAICTKKADIKYLNINTEYIDEYLKSLRKSLVNDEPKCGEIVKEYLLQLVNNEIRINNSQYMTVKSELVCKKRNIKVSKEVKVNSATRVDSVMRIDNVTKDVTKGVNYKDTLKNMFKIEKKSDETSDNDIFDL